MQCIHSCSSLFLPELDFPPVALSLHPTKPFTIKDHGQEDCADGQCNKRDADEAVLQPQAVQPRCDAITNGKAHRVANDDT